MKCKEKCYKILGFKWAYFGHGKVLVLCVVKYYVVRNRVDLLTCFDMLKREFQIDRFSYFKVNARKITSLGEWIVCEK